MRTRGGEPSRTGSFRKRHQLPSSNALELVDIPFLPKSKKEERKKNLRLKEIVKEEEKRRNLFRGYYDRTP